MINKSLLDSTRDAIQSAKRVLVLSHVRPDGDAVGSLLGCGLALEQAGKEVQMVLTDGVPETYQYLPGSDKILRRVELPVDLVIVLDCSDMDRVGEIPGMLPQPDINMDHHITNELFARINLVESEAVATAEILAENFSTLGLCLNQPVIDALLTGILTDTIGFRTINMRSQTLRTVADLIDAGGNLPELYREALLKRSFNAMRYWGAGLSSLQKDGKIVWTTLTLSDRERASYPGRDDADLINILSSIKGFDVALVFIEQTRDRIKVSWRAQTDLDVSEIAAQFGGGGHRAAAGAEVAGTLSDVQEKVLDATREIIR